MNEDVNRFHILPSPVVGYRWVAYDGASVIGLFKTKSGALEAIKWCSQH